MNILSLQSEVVYGYVGQRAARFALERLSHNVWSIPTVILSNHTGYAHVGGETLPAELILKLTSGLIANDWLARCDAVLSGYLGSAGQAEIVGDLVRKVKRANPGAFYCLDPVFGDAGRAYAKPGVAEAMARTLLPLADIVTPNAFELSSLTSVPVRDAAEAIVAARRLARPVIACTSIPSGVDRIGTLVLEEGEAWLATTPLLGNAPHGAGDLFAALFLAARLEGRTLRDCALRATSSVFAVLEKSVAAGSSEMLLIQAQEALLNPPVRADVRVERKE
ncbi:MAG: pyridoxal kinase [Rhizomicrobium sp.]|jgi:pyridoxine kinase